MDGKPLCLYGFTLGLDVPLSNFIMVMLHMSSMMGLSHVSICLAMPCLLLLCVMLALLPCAEAVVPALQPTNRHVFNYLPESIKMQASRGW